MKKYYLHNGLQESGPFTLEEIKVQDLQKSFKVWFSGLGYWTHVEFVPEIAKFLGK